MFVCLFKGLFCLNVVCLLSQNILKENKGSLNIGLLLNILPGTKKLYHLFQNHPITEEMCNKPISVIQSIVYAMYYGPFFINIYSVLDSIN